ncbi:hypothetical protein OESDEN_14385 [Oesophagostomum dentatum]|uniref:Uncharacterized protein n=1 Tax=Oesophagostomum dentatum TaxID=61180 RepID=A0A0B1SKL4_OESDE|nr:hypothetical protein OESDEN_14385 [Oesophagostomum dentatum]
MCYDERNKITGAYNPIIKRDGPSIVRNGYPPFFTRFTFKDQIRAERTEAATIDIGVIPSKWQKRFLVLTQVYQTQKDIPEYVANGTMNRMHSRMRLLTIFLPCTFFMAFTLHYMKRKPALVTE